MKEGSKNNHEIAQYGQQEESDAGEEADASAIPTDEELLQRELLDGPPPGWRQGGGTAVRGAGVKMDKLLESCLVKSYGGDPERDIDSHIVLTED